MPLLRTRPHRHCQDDGCRRAKEPVRPKLDPFIGIIDQILKDDIGKLRKQRHTAKRIYDRIRDEHEHHRRRLRTSNPIERAIQQELKCRTVKVRVFSNEESLERLVSAVRFKIDERWAVDDKAYIKWECQDA